MLLSRPFSLAAIFTLATAIPQYDSPEDIPLCAYSPIQNIITNVGCQVTETSCFCAKPDIIPSFASAVVAACDGTVNSAEVSSFASSFCVITSSATSTSTTSRRGPTPTPAGVTVTTTDNATTSRATASTVSITTSATSTSLSSSTSSMNPGVAATNSSPSATATPSDESGGNPNLGMSALALAIAIGGMTWIFSDL